MTELRKEKEELAVTIEYLKHALAATKADAVQSEQMAVSALCRTCNLCNSRVSSEYN